MTLTTRPSHSLPNELVERILLPQFHVPDRLFRDNSSDKSPFSGPSPFPCSNLLLVCKQWMRVATPLLYSVVILRSDHQANALAAALHKNPSFGEHVKKLRLERGLGRAMRDIIQLSPHITELALLLDLRIRGKESDSVSGLVGSLHLLHPKILVVIDGRLSNSSKGLDNDLTHSLTRELCACITRQWHTLETCYFPHDAFGSYYGVNATQGRRRQIATSLALSPSIRVVYMPYECQMDDLRELSKSKSLCSIRIKPTGSQHELIYFPILPREQIKGDDRLRELVQFEDEMKKDPATVASTPHLANPNIASAPMNGVSDEDKDFIWTRIIEYVFDLDASPTISSNTPSQPPLRERDLYKIVVVKSAVTLTSPAHIRIAMVSRLFHRLTMNLLPYRNLRLYDLEDVKKAQNLISLDLAQHIRSIIMPNFGSAHISAKVDLTRLEKAVRQIVAASRNLKYFKHPLGERGLSSGSFEHALRWNWDFINSFNGAALTQLSGLLLNPPKVKKGFLSLSKFENLTELELFCTEQDYRGRENLKWPPGTLSKLERLICSEQQPTDCRRSTRNATTSSSALRWRTSILDIILQLQLPSIRSFSMKNEEMMFRPYTIVFAHEYSAPKEVPPDFKAFIAKHGSKLESLELGLPGPNYSPFDHCKNLTHLTMFVGRSPPHKGFFHSERKDLSLKKLTFDQFRDLGTHSHDPWFSFFWSVDLSAFPSLELHIPACEWPTNEAQERKSQWTRRSERLKKEFNVKLTDATGLHWVPRQGSASRKRDAMDDLADFLYPSSK